MNTIRPQFHFAPLYLGAAFCMASLLPAHGQVTASATNTPPTIKPGMQKVTVMARDNNIATSAGGLTAPPAAGAPAGGAKGKATPAAVKETVADLDKWTHTTKKSLTVDLVNQTTQNLDVNVKSTFLGKDEGGKHEVVTEKTVENKVTLLPGKPSEFTTEEVSFTHTAMHRPPTKAAGGSGGRNAKAPVATPEAASGHAYFGYRVEVYVGNDLVGLTMSANQ